MLLMIDSHKKNFIWKAGESGDKCVSELDIKLLPKLYEWIYSENNLSNTKPNKLKYWININITHHRHYTLVYLLVNN